MYHKLIELLKILALCFRRRDYTLHKTDNGFEKLLNKIYIVCLLVFKALLVYEMHIGKNKENEIDSKVSNFQPFQKRWANIWKVFQINSESVLCKITKSSQMKFYDAKQIIPFCIHWIKSRNAHNFARRNIYVELHYIISFYRVTKFVFLKSLFSY